MKTRALTIVGFLVSAGVIAWLIYHFDFAEALEAIRVADLRWIALGLGLYSGLFVVRGYRWHLMLEPMKRIPLGITSEVLVVGAMANNILPARLGDVARAFVLAKKADIPASATFSNVMLERIFDGLTVVGLLNLVLFVAPPEDEWVRTVGFAMVPVFGGAIVVCALIATKEAWFLGLARRLTPKPLLGLVGIFEKLAAGLHTLKSPSRVAKVLALSLVIWVLEASVYVLLQRAFGMTIPFFGMVLVMSVLTLGLTAPSGPGFAGWFELLVIKSVALYGVGKADAAAFSIILHGVHFLPTTLMGLFFAWRSGVRLGDLSAAAQTPVAADSKVEPSAPVL